MKRILFLFLISMIFNAKDAFTAIYEVKNIFIKQEGLNEKTIVSWFTKYPQKQPYNGRDFYDLFSDKLYDTSLLDFKPIKPECVRIVDQSAKKGSFTEKLFFVYVNTHCLGEEFPNKFSTKLVIKSSANAQAEMTNLGIVDKSELTKTALLKDFPKLALAQDYFYFIDSRNKMQYFTVLHAAPGKSLYEIYKHGNFIEVEQAFAALGKAMGKLHNHFMKNQTQLSSYFEDDASPKEINNLLKSSEDSLYSFYHSITHGDAHWSNIFFSEDLNKITFIDNETFARSLQMNDGLSILTDIERVYNVPILFWEERDKCSYTFDEETNSCEKLEKIFETFFKNYIESYPLNERKYLAFFLNSFLTSHYKILLFAPDDIYDPGTKEYYKVSFMSANFSKEIADKLTDMFIVQK